MREYIPVKNVAKPQHSGKGVDGDALQVAAIPAVMRYAEQGSQQKGYQELFAKLTMTEPEFALAITPE